MLKSVERGVVAAVALMALIVVPGVSAEDGGMAKLCSVPQFTDCAKVSAKQCMSVSESCAEKFASADQEDALEACLLDELGLSQQQAQACFAATRPNFNG